MKYRWIYRLGILGFVLGLVAGGWLLWPRGINSDQAALAQLGIDNLTCGSCVENVKGALAALPGIGRVEVSVTSGTGRGRIRSPAHPFLNHLRAHRCSRVSLPGDRPSERGGRSGPARTRPGAVCQLRGGNRYPTRFQGRIRTPGRLARQTRGGPPGLRRRNCARRSGRSCCSGKC